MKKEVQDPCYRRDYKITAYVLANIAFFSFTAKVIYDKVQFNRSLEKEIENLRKFENPEELRDSPLTISGTPLTISGTSNLGLSIPKATLCRSKILDGSGRLIGTYATECDSVATTLTISTFEKP